MQKLLIALALFGSASAARVDVADVPGMMDAIAAGSEVSLTANIILEPGQMVEVTGETMIFGNGNKIKARGGDLFAVKDGGMLTLDDVKLTMDTDEQEWRGCVVVAAGGSLSAKGTTFEKCRASGDGGGVNAMTGAKSVAIETSLFTECMAKKGKGGGLYSEAASTTVTDTTFTMNKASSHGGALAIESLGGEAQIVASTITKNAEGDSPRSTIFLKGLKDLTFDGNTVSDNTAKGSGIMHLSSLTDATLSNSVFSGNTERAIRAFQLYAGGTIMFDTCTFEDNVANAENGGQEYPEGGAAMFIKESPLSRIIIKDSVFRSNVAGPYTGDIVARGGALTLAANAEVVGCTFEENAADEGGAVYLMAVNKVDFKDTTFTNNKAIVSGGAVAATPHEDNVVFPGTVSFTGVTASGNTAAEDSDKSGGAFLKAKGGHVTMRDVMLSGHATSPVGLKLAAAKIYSDIAGGITVSDNVEVDLYCGASAPVTALVKNEDGYEVTETGFSASGFFGLTEHDSCPGSSGGCEDSSTWAKKNEDQKDCSWVAKSPKARCAVKDENAVFAFEECKAACGICGKACEDSDDWASANSEDKTCAWAKRFINRCAAVDEDGTYGYEACGKSCHACDASA